MIFDGDRDKLGEYIREMADIMALRDWSIVLMHDPPQDAQHTATIELIYGQRRATLRVVSTWMDQTPENLRHTITHELLHCHINPIRDALEHIHDGIGDFVYYPMFHTMNILTEHAVDGIAAAWAETLPLPVLETEDEAA